MYVLLIILGTSLLLFWYSLVRNKRVDRISFAAQLLIVKAPADGGFYKSPFRSQTDFLDFMGQFFKHQKHEWIFIAFMKNESVDQFWVNKGPDGESVGLYNDFLKLNKICKENGYNQILVGHNHPGSALSKSGQDRVLPEQYIDELAKENITAKNLEYVAGSWRKYGLSVGRHLRRLLSG